MRRNNNGKGHAYDYLVVIDFEATCDEGENPTVTRENQEIIEFPWVVVDLSTAQIVDQQQLYVRPQWTQRLTAFCTSLTGITDEQLVGAPTLEEAIAHFDHYVATNFTARGHSFCILTDGDWDLKLQFLSETTKKGIQRAPHYMTYFNLKEEFKKEHPHARSTSLKAMLDQMSLPLEGRHHSGFDDCLNICNIVTGLLQMGHRFTAPIVIEEDFDPTTEPSLLKDYNKTNLHMASIFAPLRAGEEEGDDDEEAEEGEEGENGAQKLTKKKKKQALPGRVVVLRGLPWSASEEDVRQFFDGLNVVEQPDGVHLIHNRNGRPSGVAYVQFATAEEAKAALDHHNNYLGDRYIEVYASNEEKRDSVLAKLDGTTSTTTTETAAPIVGGSGGEEGAGNGGGKQELMTNVRPGDWYCPNCGDHQFASRNLCRKCSTPRSYDYIAMTSATTENVPPLLAGGVGGVGSEAMTNDGLIMVPPTITAGTGMGMMATRPGDWYCPNCADMNFASRQACRKCGTPSPLLGGGFGGGLPTAAAAAATTAIATGTGLTEIRAGDWLCPSCQDLNFASRAVCRKCRTPNPFTTGVNATAAGSGGGGRGHTHQHNNYRGRGGGGGGGRGGGGGYRGASGRGGVGGAGGRSVMARPGDWFCACSELNFASRAVCRRCGGPRSAAQQVVEEEEGGGDGQE